MTINTNNLIACGECDALHREVDVPLHGLATCSRCGAELYRNRPESLDRTLALVVTAAVVFGIANFYPLMGLDAKSLRTSAHLIDMTRGLVEAGMESVATLVFVTTIAMPLLQILGMLYMLLPLQVGIVPRRLHFAYRLVKWSMPWGMVEVYLLGCLVSLVRLTQVAEVDPGIGIFAIGAYVLLVAAAVSSFEPRELWSRVEALGEPLPALQEGTRL